jgi:hypothetical protein
MREAAVAARSGGGGCLRRRTRSSGGGRQVWSCGEAVTTAKHGAAVEVVVAAEHGATVEAADHGAEVEATQPSTSSHEAKRRRLLQTTRQREGVQQARGAACLRRRCVFIYFLHSSDNGARVCCYMEVTALAST